MLLHEIASSEALRRDREARQRGKALLQTMTELQGALLGDGDAGAALDRLADLLESVPQAADPGLDSLIRGITVRATVELCRRRPA